MLGGIDVRNDGATRGPEVVERGRRDHPHRILQWSRYMKDEAEVIGGVPSAVRYAFRRHVTGAFAIGDQLITRIVRNLLGLSLRRLVGRCRLGDQGLYRTQAQTTGQRGSAF